LVQSFQRVNAAESRLNAERQLTYEAINTLRLAVYQEMAGCSGEDKETAFSAILKKATKEAFNG
jgi:hypothetical protein